MQAESQPRVAAWENPAWVLAVMCYPHEALVLERIAHEQEIMMRPATEKAIRTEAVRTGKTAGNVLMVLYALAASPWRISEPSFARAIHIAGELAKAERSPGAPRGHTKIEQSYDRMRSVAHLWAAFRLHWEFPIGPHEELLHTDESIRTLLGIARGVQNWALAWAPGRTNPRYAPAALLGDDPWLIPDTIAPLIPPWKQRPDWLLDTNDTYTRRSR